MLKRLLVIATVILSVMPALASADAIVKCVQRGLKEAGHNPRGVDGIIGPNTRAAAKSWSNRPGLDLPDLEAETAPRWCAAVLERGESVLPEEPGTERYCIWFDEVLTGIWLDPNGSPVLRFRYASSDGGAGCYSWLNTVPDWLIHETGLQIIRVDREEAVWSSGDEENGIMVNLESGLAEYRQNGFTTLGVLTK